MGKEKFLVSSMICYVIIKVKLALEKITKAQRGE